MRNVIFAINITLDGRYYDRNIRNEREFREKLRYIHRNPVKRGLVLEPGEWKWSSFRHYALREKGLVEIESEWTARDRERQAHVGPERMAAATTPNKLVMKKYMNILRTSCEMLTCSSLGVKPIN